MRVMGYSQNKQAARRYCYWPGITKDIEEMSKHCEACQTSQAAPRADLSSWPQPCEPWDRIHVDFAGPFLGHMWLLVVDALSNYPYVMRMQHTTAPHTIDALKKVFVTEGLPRVLISDNGPQFISAEFQKFCKSSGIQHILAPPFHPQSNGEVERLVQTFKSAMLKATRAGASVEQALLSMLTTYRALPNMSGRSPAQVLHGRQPRTLLSLLFPEEVPVSTKGAKFKRGDKVLVRVYGSNCKWQPAIVTAVRGGRVYVLRTEDRAISRHQSQIRRRYYDSVVDKQQAGGASAEQGNRKCNAFSLFKPAGRSGPHWIPAQPSRSHLYSRSSGRHCGGATDCVVSPPTSQLRWGGV